MQKLCTWQIDKQGIMHNNMQEARKSIGFEKCLKKNEKRNHANLCHNISTNLYSGMVTKA